MKTWYKILNHECMKTMMMMTMKSTSAEYVPLLPAPGRKTTHWRPEDAPHHHHGHHHPTTQWLLLVLESWLSLQLTYFYTGSQYCFLSSFSVVIATLSWQPPGSEGRIENWHHISLLFELFLLYIELACWYTWDWDKTWFWLCFLVRYQRFSI